MGIAQLLIAVLCVALSLAAVVPCNAQVRTKANTGAPAARPGAGDERCRCSKCAITNTCARIKEHEKTCKGWPAAATRPDVFAGGRMTNTIADAARIIDGNDCEGYMCNTTNPEDCSCKSGICCLKTVVVNPKFDLASFDRMVAAGDDEKIRQLFAGDRTRLGLDSLLATKSGKAIADGVGDGTLAFEKVSHEGHGRYLIRTTKALTTEAPKYEYIGHVTLLK